MLGLSLPSYPMLQRRSLPFSNSSIFNDPISSSFEDFKPYKIVSFSSKKMNNDPDYEPIEDDFNNEEDSIWIEWDVHELIF